MRDNGGVKPTDESTSPTSAPSDPAPTEPTPEPTEPNPAAVRRRRVGLFAVVGVLVLVIDIVSKQLVVAHLDPAQSVRVIPGVIWLYRTSNAGAAFSLGTSFTVILSVIALAVVAVIVRTASRLRSVGWAIALGLILGGALGNLVDRIFRAPGVFRGRVIDWISIFGPAGQRWPIFNLADSAIVCGAILAAVLTLFGVSLNGAREAGKRR